MAVPSVFPIKATLEEYFELLSQPDSLKLCFLDGVIVSPEGMSGGGYEHASVISNTSFAIGKAIGTRACRWFDASLMIRAEAARTNLFPDISITCENPDIGEFRGNAFLKNPQVIIEVLSPTTEANDRGKKFAIYQTIESLKNYVLISSERRRVEVFSRVSDGWHLTIYTESADQVEISALGISLSMDEIFRHLDIELSETETPS